MNPTLKWGHLMAKTTAKDFKLFKGACEKWIDFFGLKGWEVSFRHEKIEDNARAEITFNAIEDRMACIVLGIDWLSNPVNDRIIRKVAFHEVMEIFCRRWVYLAYERGVRDIEIAEEKHHIIRTLENVIFENME